MSINFDQMFPSNYLRASDLGSNSHVVTIDGVSMETMKDGKSKPIVKLRGKDKRWVLNKTCGATLAHAFGKSTDTWTGQRVELYAETVTGPQGLTQGIRCRPVKQAAPAPASVPFNDPVDDIGADQPAPF